MKGGICIFLGIALSVAAQVSCWSSTYRAAVVEYNPVMDKTDEATMNKNAAEFIKFMAQASKKRADIIVFPEGGLFSSALSVIPDPADRIAPGDDPKFETTKAVKDLSAASKLYKIYTVINLREKRMCEAGDESCPPAGYYIYNTNVVFDRNGVVIARYAKYNLFERDVGTKPKDPELVFFDTDFGVRFGTFICFDILFSTPAQRLVQQFHITDFVFTTYWFSELPFLTALQAQRGWAETNNVNLLASGVNSPMSASFGSGIYNGKYGNLVQIMPETPTSKLLIADVPKIKNTTCENYFYGDSTHPGPLESIEVPQPQIGKVDTANDVPLLKDVFRHYKSELITPGKTFEDTICSNNDFCCDFKVTMDSLMPQSKNYTHRAVVYNGVRNFGSKFRGGVQTCGVVACNGPDIANCTERLKEIPGLFKFTEIKITGNFNRRNSFQMPSTLTDGKDLKPLSSNQYEFLKKVSEKGLEVSLELMWPVYDLHTFAIWGRDFTRDNEPLGPESGASGVGSMPVLLTTLLGFFLFVR